MSLISELNRRIQLILKRFSHGVKLSVDECFSLMLITKEGYFHAFFFFFVVDCYVFIQLLGHIQTLKFLLFD